MPSINSINSATLRIESGAAGWEARTLPLCYAASPETRCWKLRSPPYNFIGFFNLGAHRNVGAQLVERPSKGPAGSVQLFWCAYFWSVCRFLGVKRRLLATIEILRLFYQQKYAWNVILSIQNFQIHKFKLWEILNLSKVYFQRSIGLGPIQQSSKLL